MFAFINDNKVLEVKDVSEDEAMSSAHLFQRVIDISLMSPMPAVGWVYDNGILYRNIPSVTPRQIRQALVLSGVSLDLIESALNSLPEPTRSLAKAEWEYSNEFERSRPLVANVGLMLGWTSDQLDNLWLFAGSLK